MIKKQQQYPHESELKAFLKERNKQLAKQSGGISINPYNYMSKHGMARPTPKNIQEEIEYQKFRDFEDLDENGKPKLKYVLNAKGNKIKKGIKKIYHY